MCVGYWDKQCGGYIDGNRYRHNRVINRCESAEMGKWINSEMTNNEMLKDGSWKYIGTCENIMSKEKQTCRQRNTRKC